MTPDTAVYAKVYAMNWGVLLTWGAGTLAVVAVLLAALLYLGQKE